LDVGEVPTGESPFVTYEPMDPSSRRGLGLRVETERINVAVRWIAGGDAVDVAAHGRDMMLNILEGTGDIQRNGSSIPLTPGSAVLLTGGDSAVLAAATDLRVVEGRATGWRPSDALE
jgi:uncharacterized cupin superfamily protein